MSAPIHREACRGYAWADLAGGGVVYESTRGAASLVDVLAELSGVGNVAILAPAGRIVARRGMGDATWTRPPRTLDGAPFREVIPR